MPEFTNKLKRASSRFVGWRLQLACLLTLVALVGVLLGLSFIDRLNPMQERTSLAIMGGLLVFGFVFLVGQFVLVEIRRPRNQPMARKVEEDHPELMDLFNCAVDLTERKSFDEMNAMERRVVEEASQKTADLAMEQSLLPKPALRQLSLLGIAISCGALAYSQVLSPVRKALNSLEDLRAGVVSGLSILPGTDEFPKGSDVVVQARIYRGTQQAWVEYENVDGQRVKEAMRLDGDESKVQYDIQKAVPAKDSSYTLLHTEMPHGLSDGQAVELSGTGWADGIHRATVNDEHVFLINTSLPPNVGPGGQMRPVPCTCLLLLRRGCSPDLPRRHSRVDR